MKIMTIDRFNVMATNETTILGSPLEILNAFFQMPDGVYRWSNPKQQFSAMTRHAGGKVDWAVASGEHHDYVGKDALLRILCVSDAFLDRIPPVTVTPNIKESWADIKEELSYQAHRSEKYFELRGREDRLAVKTIRQELPEGMSREFFLYHDMLLKSISGDTLLSNLAKSRLKIPNSVLWYLSDLILWGCVEVYDVEAPVS